MNEDKYYSIDNFLESYKKEIEKLNKRKYNSKNWYKNDWEESLYLLIELYKDNLKYSLPKDDPTYFHAQFRKYDIINFGEGKMDMVFYYLIESSKVFNKVMNKLYGEK